MSQFREVPAEQKREVGVRLNELKNAIQEQFNTLKENLSNNEEELCDIDLTRSSYPTRLGTRHPFLL